MASLHRCPCGSHWPESGGIPDKPSFADDFATGSREALSKIWRGVVGAMEKVPWVPWKKKQKVLLRELEAGLHVLTCTNGVDRNTRVLWPESAWRSDLLNFVGAFDPGPGQPYLRPDDIMGFPDSLDMG